MIEDRIRLCFLIPSFEIGGMERVMSELINYFSKNEKLELFLILFGKNPIIRFDLNPSVKVITPKLKYNKFIRLVYGINTLFFIRRQVNAISPKAVLSFGEYWNVIVLLSLIGTKSKVYISDRCSPARKYSFLHSKLRKWLYKDAEGIVAQTQIAKNYLQQEIGHGNIRVIGNPIRKISNNNGVVKEQLILSIGRLINTKNFDKLIEVFLETNIEGWKLIIVGSNALNQNNWEKLNEIIAKNNATDKILLIQAGNDIESYYLKSKIFAFMSSSEGFPNVIGEAMRTGTAVIAFDCIAGPSDLISNQEDGLLVELYDFGEFKKKLVMLMRDEELRERIANNAQKKVELFNIEIVGSSYLNFLLSSAGSPD